MNREKLDINNAVMTLDSLCIYRNLLEDPVLRSYRALLGNVRDGADPDMFAELYAAFFNLLAAKTADVNLTAYAAGRIILDENPFTLAFAGHAPEETQMLLSRAAQRDLALLQAAVSLTPGAIKNYHLTARPVGAWGKMIEGLPEWKVGREAGPEDSAAGPVKNLLLSGGSWSDRIADLQEFHREHGSGSFAGHYAFTWQCGRFSPVANPDPVRLSDLIGYETEREEVVRNTEQFLRGYAANNVLLYGDRGTGKSSTVKALLNEYHDRGLRMIEVSRSSLTDFPEIAGQLAGKTRQKFILFVDDLAFEDSEENYTALKAVLEGGLEAKPANVLIYATSNRRHLVKEKFSDRAGLHYGTADDEVRAADSMQEKLSLSDRFGITAIFSSPDKKRYLEIIDELAERKGIDMDRETLHREAMKWELWYNGRSPRTAQQFISWLEGGRQG